MYQKRAKRLHSVSAELRNSSDAVATSGSTSDKFLYLLVLTETLNKLLYSFNIDDDFLSDIKELLTDKVTDLTSDADHIDEVFQYAHKELLPKFEKIISKWLKKTTD